MEDNSNTKNWPRWETGSTAVDTLDTRELFPWQQIEANRRNDQIRSQWLSRGSGQGPAGANGNSAAPLGGSGQPTEVDMGPLPNDYNRQSGSFDPAALAKMDTSELLKLADSLLMDTSKGSQNPSQPEGYMGPDMSGGTVPIMDDPGQMAALQDVVGRSNKARSARGAPIGQGTTERPRIASEQAAMSQSSPMDQFAMQVAMGNDRQTGEDMTRNRMMRSQMNDMEDQQKAEKRRRMAALLYGIG